ncbi:beta-glucoside-specific PTS transporter subunit IIABC [Brochothrix campestris]|uniref:PTS system beta-glucoside-specific transporter subunit IIABC n=1 Tax=Brochothrix campestris FSL F6-1037 TaxID=1265861 RepID=W7CX65_9LIST|nr:beta-glucoside-specific PTS transporter subunit IIABC [Brochothrix campestris]EUJ37643.1 PTS system beta-glucoside-specific transporter subunit IIABC [Brochothrix campestris FSL F6-1037]
MADKYKDIAAKIVENVGGEQNVDSVVHCATRLRFVLKDESKANKEALESVDKVMSVVRGGGQYQVVIGSEVNDVYTSINNNYNVNSNGEAAQDNTPKKKSASGALAVIASFFTPYIGVLAGAGIVMALVNTLEMYDVITKTSLTYVMLTAISTGIFKFLPLFIAITAADAFKMNRFIALAIASAMVYPLVDPSIGELVFKPFGYNVDFNKYGGAVVPTILAIWVTSYVERFFKKIIPAAAKIVFVPFFTLLVAGVLAFLFIGPLGTLVGDWISKVYTYAYDLNPLIAGLILGGLFQLLVVFGMHWAILPIAMINIDSLGYDTILPVMLIAVFGQVSAVAGMIFRLKGKDKEVAVSATIAGFFGITEPALYGVNLKYKRPFIIGLIASAVGGAIVSYSGVTSDTFSPILNPLYFNFFMGENSNFTALVIAFVITIAIGMIGAIMFGLPKPKQTATATTTQAKAETTVPAVAANTITSPLTGELVELKDVNDPVFSAEIMGKGFAVIPSEGVVTAPVDGEVIILYGTQHAIGIKSEQGIEVLIHIGINTVELNGEFFEMTTSTGAHVKRGEVLGKFNIEGIKSKEYDTTTMVIVTNTADYADFSFAQTTGAVKMNDAIVTVSK